MRLALHETDRTSIRAALIAAGCVLVVLGSGFFLPVSADAAAEPGVLMGAEQKAHWDEGTAPCPKSEDRYCADEISQSQFVAWPFIAEHTGTVDAIFAALGTGETTGAEVGIFANRRYHYAEIEYRGEEENGTKETWTPERFKEFELEIPPEDPGALLGTSGKVPESQITNKGWTEFKLENPVKVVKGEKYWLTNTTFQKAYGTGSEEFHKYQLFYHERVSGTEDQPWGNYTNEPLNWEHAARKLRELPSPEQTRIDCEKCNTEGWLQEEPKGFELLNTNRGAQEEGGQTYSYAYGTIEEGTGHQAPTVQTGEADEITQTRATLSATVNPNGDALADCSFEYGTTTGYGQSAPCRPQPGATETPTAVTATVRGLSPGTAYHFRVTATNTSGTSAGADGSLRTLPTAPTVQTGEGDEITQTRVTLSATVNPNGGELSDCSFEYGTTTGYGQTAPCSPQPGLTNTPTTVTATIRGLAPGLTYHYRITATNVTGTATGEDETLRTLPTAPVVQTEAATAVTQTSVTLNAAVNPDGGELSACDFEYGPDAGYGHTVPCASLPGAGEGPTAVTATLTGLTPATTYQYRVVATNAGGQSFGEAATLTTQLPTTLPPGEPLSPGAPVAPGEPSAPNIPLAPQEQGGPNTRFTPEQPGQPSAAGSHLASTTLSAGSGGVVKDALTCPPGGPNCTWSVVLETSTPIVVKGSLQGKYARPRVVTLAHGTFAAAAGHTATITLRLSATARRLLAKSQVLTARALVTSIVSGSQSTTQTLVKLHASHNQHSVDRRVDA